MELPTKLAPVVFNGQTSMFAEAWLARFEDYAKFHQWTDDKKVTAFGLFMVGPAEMWYRFLTDEHRKDYKSVKCQFQKQYYKVENIDLRQKAFEKLNKPQTSDESVTDYIARMKTVLFQLKNVLDSKFRRDIMVSQLRPELKPTLAIREPATEHDVEGIARIAEYAQFPTQNQRLSQHKELEKEVGEITADIEMVDPLTEQQERDLIKRLDIITIKCEQLLKNTVPAEEPENTEKQADKERNNLRTEQQEGDLLKRLDIITDKCKQLMNGTVLTDEQEDVMNQGSCDLFVSQHSLDNNVQYNNDKLYSRDQSNTNVCQNGFNTSKQNGQYKSQFIHGYSPAFTTTNQGRHFNQENRLDQGRQFNQQNRLGQGRQFNQQSR
jgi:hypothetical protein